MTKAAPASARKYWLGMYFLYRCPAPCISTQKAMETSAAKTASAPHWSMGSGPNSGTPVR